MGYNKRKKTYDFGTGSVEDVASAACGVERYEEQRTAVVDSVVADADEIASNNGNGAFDCVETDEIGFAGHRRLQRNVSTLSHL